MSNSNEPRIDPCRTPYTIFFWKPYSQFVSTENGRLKEGNQVLTIPSACSLNTGYNLVPITF